MQAMNPAEWPALGVDVFVFLVFKGVPVTLGLLLARRLLGQLGPGARSGAWAAGVLALAVLPFVQLKVAGWGGGIVQYPEGWLEAGSGAWPLGTWLFLAWAAGSLYLLGRFGGALAAVALATRRTRPAGERAAERFRAAVRRMGIRRPVRLRIGDVPGAPLTWGWLRPVVVLPAEARSWDAGELDAVLYHELAHVVRHDFPLLVAMELARALHWPNPLMWRLLRGARTDQELACDAATLRRGVGREAYARQLLALARSRVQEEARPEASLPVVPRSRLGDRVRFVLDGDRAEGATPSAVVVTLAAAASSAVLVLASVNPWLDCV